MQCITCSSEVGPFYPLSNEKEIFICHTCNSLGKAHTPTGDTEPAVLSSPEQTDTEPPVSEQEHTDTNQTEAETVNTDTDQAEADTTQQENTDNDQAKAESKPQRRKTTKQ